MEWERRTDDDHGDDPVIVLDVGACLAADFVLHFALHAGVAAARKRTADFNSVHGRHGQAAGPIRAQHTVAFQLAGDIATEIEDRLGRLMLERVAERVVADGADPSGEGSTPALGFDLQQAGYLHGRCQKDGIEDLLPGVPWRLAAFRQRAYAFGEIKDLIEVGFKPMAGQV